MNLSEYNQTKKQIESMIFSSEEINCSIACEVLKGLEMDSCMKLDWINPIIGNFNFMAKMLIKNGSDKALEKSRNLIAKIDILLEASNAFIK